jgi:hypothetical protein
VTRHRAIHLSLVALLCLLLGAATTAGVAWWLFASAGRGAVASTRWGGEYDWETRIVAAGVRLSEVPSGRGGQSTSTLTAGWPLPALQTTSRQVAPPLPSPPRGQTPRPGARYGPASSSTQRCTPRRRRWRF